MQGEARSLREHAAADARRAPSGHHRARVFQHDTGKRAPQSRGTRACRRRAVEIATPRADSDVRRRGSLANVVRLVRVRDLFRGRVGRPGDHAEPRGAPRAAARRQRGFLRRGHASLPVGARDPEPRGLCVRHPHGRRDRIGGATAVARPQPRREHRRAGLLQVRELFHRHRRRRASRAHGAARHRAPRGDFVLHVQDDELHDRRVSPAAARVPELVALRDVRVVFPGARRRTDRPRVGVPAADGPSDSPRLASHDVGHADRADGRDEEDARRRSAVDVRRPRVREAGAVLAVGRVRGGPRLRDPDLLRLLGLLGHGHRAGADRRLRPAGQLRDAVPVTFDHGILAPLAHHVVASGSATTCTSRWAETGGGARGRTSI